MRGAYWAYHWAYSMGVWLDIPAAEGVQLQLGSSGGVACARAAVTSKASLCGGGCAWLSECVRARARVCARGMGSGGAPSQQASRLEMMGASDDEEEDLSCGLVARGLWRRSRTA